MISRRALITMLAVGWIARLQREPTMRIEIEMTAPRIDGAVVLPTGRRFHSIDGRRVSEAAFFAAAAVHPNPIMRDWAQAWKESR